MYIKVFPHGKGPGAGPVNYLTRLDYPDRAETPPTVLRGDPEMIKSLIDAQTRVWKFSAGVCSWANEDNVSPEQEQKLMDDFEKLAFAGMQPDQYNILWVRHSHANHHELHFVIPRVELSTGKAFNAFPPGWQKDFDVLRDLYNYRENWARPDDPARARFCTPDHADLHQARLKRWGIEPQPDVRSEAKNAIHNYLRQQIENGLVKDRVDVIQKLEDAGLAINRTGKDYLTVKDPNSGAKLRLKGGIYRKEWNLDRISGQNQQQNTTRGSGPGNDHSTRVRELSRQLEQSHAKRAGYNAARYLQNHKANARAGQLANKGAEYQLWQTLAGELFDGNEHIDGLGAGQRVTDKSFRSPNQQQEPNYSHTETRKAIVGNDHPAYGISDLGHITDGARGATLRSVTSQYAGRTGREPWRPTSHKTGVAIDGTENHSIGAPEQAGYGNKAYLHNAGKSNQGHGNQTGGIGAELAKFERTLQEFRTLNADFEQLYIKQKLNHKHSEIER